MSRLAIAAAFTLLLFVAARTQDRKAVPLAPGVYFWEGDTSIRRPANCTWVVFQDYVVVIDANFPWGAREILAEIKQTTNLPVRFVFNTHYHADHTFGSGVFREAGAAIVCSRECGAESRAKGEGDWRNQIFTRGARPNASVHDKAVATETREKGYRLEHPTVLFDERMVFDDGNRRLELVRMGPGHSRGDAVAYLPREKILITGDLCVNWTHGNNMGDPDADHDNWIRALDLLAQWDVKAVVPGHGRLGDVETLRGQTAYLADMVGRVRAGIQAGKGADALAAEIDLSRHHPFGAGSSASSVRAVYRKLSGTAR
jgi:glyoxylase-like metal-dependent hydrolase (beta-lactamase superfamily II)